jgi:hypothetical protein
MPWAAALRRARYAWPAEAGDCGLLEFATQPVLPMASRPRWLSASFELARAESTDILTGFVAAPHPLNTGSCRDEIADATALRGQNRTIGARARPLPAQLRRRLRLFQARRADI